MEHICKMTFEALFDAPHVTFFDFIRIFSDPDARETLTQHLTNEIAKEFWQNEFEHRDQEFHTQAIVPVLKKIERILSHDYIKYLFSSGKDVVSMADILS